MCESQFLSLISPWLWINGSTLRNEFSVTFPRPHRLPGTMVQPAMLLSYRRHHGGTSAGHILPDFIFYTNIVFVQPEHEEMLASVEQYVITSLESVKQLAFKSKENITSRNCQNCVLFWCCNFWIINTLCTVAIFELWIIWIETIEMIESRIVWMENRLNLENQLQILSWTTKVGIKPRDTH